MKKLKAILNGYILKSILLTFLPVIFSILATLSLTINKGHLQITDRRIFGWTVFVVICDLVTLIFYGVTEKHDKAEYLKNKKNNIELNSLDPFFQAFEKIVFDNSDRLYHTLRKRHGHFDIEDWVWIQERGDKLCDAMYNFIARISEKGEHFSVSIIFKKIEHSTSGYTMSSRCAPKNPIRPSIYRAFISETDAEGKYYKKLLDAAISDYQILATELDVNANFSDHAGDYSQFIALPISCTGGNIIGILQIAAYKGSIISASREELERLCSVYFNMGSTIMLLTDKIENTHQLFG